jgi:hypothetical protein
MTNLVNGSTFGTSATLPATIDTAGYAAVVFTLVGDIIDIGEVAKAYNVVAHQPVGERFPTKLKGDYDISNLTVTIGRDISGAGQILLQTALGVDVSYSFEITLPSGNIGNFTGKVIKAGTGPIAADGVETTLLEIAIDPETLLEE